ncbi:MAG: PepSY domain-containing protein [Glaciimonas sp.]|nr:PepSY domain-containing protein [Glaciimonas sp.]
MISSIYALHLGSFFGLMGRIIMTLTGLVLPLFSLIGWLLYLGRRRRKWVIWAKQAALNNA